RERLARAIAAANAGLFSRLYDSLADGNAFSPDAASAGRRALRNVLLDYLSVEPGAIDRARLQFRSATNMTDRAAALTVLAHRHPCTDAAAVALADFERRYRGDHLVLDKWFQIQATVPGHDTVDSVAALTRHPAFSITNPNRVRALVGTFSSANQTGFHRPDGAGYAFFAEIVLRVERTNPQIAARLATAMRSWRSLEPVRQQKAREALLSISRAKDLSPDLRDIVERTLS
ncbi:MAG TPA: aminopeptidase N C-terminal domain-containing protein, partial [Rhizobiales bacterium]|nr:aminopeptidase N C-terminal domain-containing protein [Hyphomicrobiales bacterium]